ncbi:MAG: carbohydrate kinase [Saprospiraceae bacterium]|nr:MAG: carbohydrate kinase [Saprospiraceae bacterium]
MYLIGYDIGSSSVKAALVDAITGETVTVIQRPEQEMAMQAPQPGWAQQDPAMWWQYVCEATTVLLHKSGVVATDIRAIGIAYQMHGLVIVDKNHEALRPSIIWCDSRAVEIGDRAFQELGANYCLSHLLNSPGNFTASKLKWVKENEPDLYQRIHKIMLPGDYIAMRLTGEIFSTISGLSEGIFWDFKKENISTELLDYYGIDAEYMPSLRPTFSEQGNVSAAAAAATGLPVGIPVTYRAGDQPNNAMALGALQPGEVAGTGGTSGVIYGVVDRPLYDPASRVNGFAHVNHTEAANRIGILLCINGAGSQYSWIHHQLAQDGISYNDMEQLAAKIPIGSDGLTMLPFGNGAERVLENLNLGAQLFNLQFNRHRREHIYRAALEGIAFAFVYGAKILEEMGLNMTKMRVGNDNLFRSAIFSSTIATLLNTRIEIVETTGAVGAARAAGVGVGLYKNPEEAVGQLKVERVFEAEKEPATYQEVYDRWHQELQNRMHHFRR